MALNETVALDDAELIAAQAQLKTLTQRPSNADLLKLYALFKQATQGACTTPSPSGFDFVAIAKHEAWHQLGSMPSAQAKQAYLDLAKGLLA